MGNYKSISGLNYFRDKIKNFLSNTIWIPPLSFRINTVAYKKANNIKNDYPNLIKDITEFLYDNGIMLLNICTVLHVFLTNSL